MTFAYRLGRAAGAQRLRPAVSMGLTGTSAPAPHACASLTEHVSEEVDGGRDDEVDGPGAGTAAPSAHSPFYSTTACTQRSSETSTGTDSGSLLSSYARRRLQGGGGAHGHVPGGASGAHGRVGVSLDGSMCTWSSVSDRAHSGAGTGTVGDSGLDFVLANPGRIVLQGHPTPIQEGEPPVQSHAISDLQAEASLPSNSI